MVEGVFAPEANCLWLGPQGEGRQVASRHSVAPQCSPGPEEERSMRDGLPWAAESKEVGSLP